MRWPSRSLLKKNLLPAAVILLWFVMTGLLIVRHYGGRTLSPDPGTGLPVSSGVLGEKWFGIYLHGEKVGHASRTVAASPRGQDLFYDMNEEMQFTLRVMERMKTIRANVTAHHNSKMKLLAFSARILSDTEVKITGVRKGTALNLTIENNGRTSARSITLAEDPALELSVISHIMKAGLKGGSRITVPVFDPLSQQIQDMTVVVAEKEAVVSLGTAREAYRLNAHLGGISFSLWLTEDGELLRQESPLGFLLVRESKEEAQKSNVPSLDLLSFLSVPFTIQLPADVGYLRVRISGIDPGRLELGGGRQRFRGDILEITREDMRTFRENQARQDVSPEYLGSTAFIQAKDQRIRTLTEEITKDRASRTEKAEAINTWVFRNLKKTPSVTIPDALDVLQTRRGDCNEHTALFTALARAAGIPSKIAVGLVYKEGAFFYHAWPEFFAGQWIAADPTFGQFPADATHIRLLTGDLDKQARILPVIGKISIEGLEYR